MTTYPQEKVYFKDNKEIIFRNLESKDIEQYLFFCEMIACETKHTLNYIGQLMYPDSIKENWQIASASPWHLELGGFDKDKLVSHLSYYKPRPHHPYEKHTIEFGIKILKEYCSKGLGSKKLSMMENIARKMGVTRIQAKVRISNYGAINFYKKHGFEIEGIKKNAVLINGLYEDEYYIAKILEGQS